MLLKGFHTILAAPDGQIFVNTRAIPAWRKAVQEMCPANSRGAHGDRSAPTIGYAFCRWVHGAWRAAGTLAKSRSVGIVAVAWHALPCTPGIAGD